MPDIKTKDNIAAGAISIAIQHELWDGNLHDHADQGVVIMVNDASGKTLLRFNCFDIEKSYIYGPDGGKNRLCRMDPTIDGNPITWTVRQLRDNLGKMLSYAGYEDVAAKIDQKAINSVLDQVETSARDIYAVGRNTVKHNRGTDHFEATSFRFGLEVRKQAGGDGGLAIHVLADLAGTVGRAYAEETEILAFDCFRDAPHYHYGPRNKNHRIFWDTTLVSDPLEWTLTQFKNGNLRDMIARAGYPGVAADYDQSVVDELMPALEKKAREMQPLGPVVVMEGGPTANTAPVYAD